MFRQSTVLLLGALDVYASQEITWTDYLNVLVRTVPKEIVVAGDDQVGR